MVKQIDLRKVIRAKLLTVCSKVYYGKAKGVPDAEYVVFSIDRSYRELSEACSLIINVVGRGDDTSNVEDLADDIWGLLDHLYYLDNDMQFSVYQNSRADVTADDETIIYRRLTFDITLH